jgi:CubicO group peptidase (beta-lactamase class C family)
VTVYASSGDTTVRAPDGARGQGAYVDGPRRSFSGGAGLLSTIEDYAKFLEMLRNGGSLGDARILSPKTVALMLTDQIPGIPTRPGHGFGLGFQIIEQPGADARMESVGTFSWGGAYGSTYEVDPVEGIDVLVMINQLPLSSPIVARVPTVVYQALVR